jgi:hypothetical protein
MSTLAGTDAFVVNRAGVNYQVTAANLMSTLADTDLLLVNRSGTNFKITGADVKSYFGPTASGGSVLLPGTAVYYNPTFDTWQSFIRSPDVTQIGGNTLYGTFYAATSPDGINWTLRPGVGGGQEGAVTGPQNQFTGNPMYYSASNVLSYAPSYTFFGAPPYFIFNFVYPAPGGVTSVNRATPGVTSPTLETSSGLNRYPVQSAGTGARWNLSAEVSGGNWDLMLTPVGGTGGGLITNWPDPNEAVNGIFYISGANKFVATYNVPVSGSNWEIGFFVLPATGTRVGTNILVPAGLNNSTVPNSFAQNPAGSTVVAGVNGKAYVFTSTDSMGSFSQVSLPAAPAGSTYQGGAYYINGNFWTMAAGAGVLYLFKSTNGLTWTQSGGNRITETGGTYPQTNGYGTSASNGQYVIAVSTSPTAGSGLSYYPNSLFV